MSATETTIDFRTVMALRELEERRSPLRLLADQPHLRDQWEEAERVLTEWHSCNQRLSVCSVRRDLEFYLGEAERLYPRAMFAYRTRVALWPYVMRAAELQGVTLLVPKEKP